MFTVAAWVLGATLLYSATEEGQLDNDGHFVEFLIEALGMVSMALLIGFSVAVMRLKDPLGTFRRYGMAGLADSIL